MIQATVDRSAFLNICKDLDDDAMEAIVMSAPETFSGALRIGDVPAKPAAKSRARKAPKVPAARVSDVRGCLAADLHTSQAIMSQCGITRGETMAAIKALIDAGEVEQVGKGRGAKYVLKAAIIAARPSA